MSIYSITKELRQESLSLKNRLQSILHDANFVSQLDLPDIPVVPNERCGRWYVLPTLQHDDVLVYFKSTDGHTNQWSFSFRRLNLHLLPVLGRHGAVAVVDSTRRGKLMPDALLKTIPLWCAVVNEILFDQMDDRNLIQEFGFSADDLARLRRDHWLVTPREMVSPSEHLAMAQRVPLFVEKLKQLDLVSAQTLARDLGEVRPVLPKWTYPGSRATEAFGSAHTIFCVTASPKVAGGATRRAIRTGDSVHSWYYVQGAADDHELWVPRDLCDGHFDPHFFWTHVASNAAVVDRAGYIHDWLGDDELIEKIDQIHQKTTASTSLLPFDVTLLGSTGLAIGRLHHTTSVEDFVREFPNVHTIVVLSETLQVEAPADFGPQPQIFHHRVALSKKGSKLLRNILPLPLQPAPVDGHTIILCDTGSDICVGVALVVLCLQFDVDWKMAANSVSKDEVKQHLAKILRRRRVNPSRNTLQSVNSAIMGR